MNPAPDVDNVRHNFMPLFREIADTHRVDMLAGDGSTRSYYRVFAGPQTYVLQTNGSDDLNYRRFLEAHRFYEGMGIPVPKVLAHHDSSRWILLEDLGSEDLQASATYQNVAHSVRLLGHLAPERVERAFAQSWLAERTLDEARFVFEMNHFIEHFVEKLIGETATETLKTELYDLAARAAQGPTVFCHRDYQSRNIMASSHAPFVMIDFQDSQWGPALYDAVSLCWDPYFVLSEADREKLFGEYLDCVDVALVNPKFRALLANPDQLNKLKELLIVERFVKAAGSFASFKTVRGKDTHLVYLEGTFEIVLAAMERLEKLNIKFPELKSRVGHWLQLAKATGWGRPA